MKIKDLSILLSAVAMCSCNNITITPRMTLNPNLFTQPLTLKIDGDFTGVDVSATQDNKPLDVTNSDSYILINFSPSAETIYLVFKQ